MNCPRCMITENRPNWGKLRDNRYVFFSNLEELGRQCINKICRQWRVKCSCLLLMHASASGAREPCTPVSVIEKWKGLFCASRLASSAEKSRTAGVREGSSYDQMFPDVGIWWQLTLNTDWSALCIKLSSLNNGNIPSRCFDELYILSDGFHPIINHN